VRQNDAGYRAMRSLNAFDPSDGSITVGGFGPNHNHQLIHFFNQLQHMIWSARRWKIKKHTVIGIDQSIYGGLNVPHVTTTQLAQLLTGGSQQSDFVILKAVDALGGRRSTGSKLDNPRLALQPKDPGYGPFLHIQIDQGRMVVRATAQLQS
jgi:hypothetical protein